MLTQRRCYKCKETKPLTVDFFYREKSRAYGLAYICIVCDRKKFKNPRPLKYKNMSLEQRQRQVKTARHYRRNTFNGWAADILKAYETIDLKRGRQFNLTKDFLREHVYGQACRYCGDIWDSIGCDRLDNTKGHTVDNVVPCCTACNRARSNYFTVDEMKTIVGPAIASVKNTRREGRLENCAYIYKMENAFRERRRARC